MSDLPTGVVAFWFTDVVGSTRLWAEAEDAMEGDLATHDEIIRDAALVHGGHVFSTAGDSFAVAFASATAAVSAAIDSQARLNETPWGVPGGIKVRMGIHLGEAAERAGDYFGPTLNTAARLMAAGHGGQILVSGTAVEVLSGFDLRPLGSHTLRDVDGAVDIFQVAGDGLDDDHPPLRTADSATTTLPSQRSSFIGRDAEIGRVRALLNRSRVVTVTGVGGVGKTRVAVEVGGAVQQEYPGGVFFVDLARVDDEERVEEAVVDGIALSVGSADARRAELDAFLRDRHVLLIMDNCEHLLDPVPDLVDELLGVAPDLHVLATSREALELDGEETYRLPSLEADGAAFRLFVERATAVDDRFEVSDANRAVIEDICRRLDGMPLAIELAASRVRTATPAELLSGLDDRFALLRAGRRRGVVQRQRTLQAAIEWSYDLLEPDEQAFLRVLGVFASTFTFDLVPDVTETSPARARDLLDSLVAKSLVTANVTNDITVFRLLETVKIFAIDRLSEADGVAEAADRHAAAFLRQIERLDVVAAPDETAIDRYLAVHTDLQAAADHFLETGRPDDALRLLRGTSFATIGAGQASLAALERLELIDREHRSGFTPELRAELDGTLGAALMNAGRFIESGIYVGRGRKAPVEPVHRTLATQISIVVVGAARPERAIHIIDKFGAEIADDPRYADLVRYLAHQRGLHLALGGELSRAFDALEACFDEVPIRAPSFQISAFLWVAYLLGRAPTAEQRRIIDEVPLRHRGYAHSITLGLILTDQRSAEERAAAITELAAKTLTGRLPLAESEFLIAFARMRLAQGEPEHARWLIEPCAPRVPWGNLVIVETLAELDAWPPDERGDRNEAEIIARVQPEFLRWSREEMPRRLADEIAAWAKH